VTRSLSRDGERVYSVNITHNLIPMAEAAGIYRPLWRPEECGIVTAAQLAEAIAEGAARLRDTPALAALNPENGWGSWDILVEEVAGILAACWRWPDATVEASR